MFNEPVNWRFPDPRRPRNKPLTEYQKYLESTHWKLFKFNIFAKRGMVCERCKSTKDINLHHRNYSRVGRETAADVEVLCRVCHSREHTMTPERLQALHRWLYSR